MYEHCFWRFKIKIQLTVILFQIFYRCLEVDDITNTGHYSRASDCVPKMKKKQKNKLAHKNINKCMQIWKVGEEGGGG